MAKLKLIGTAAVITSNIKAEVLSQLSKFKPKALQLVDSDKNIVFAVGGGPIATASKKGITFNSTNTEGFATATFDVGNGIVDKEAYAKDNFGYAMLKLNELEVQIVGAASELEADFNAMSNSISVE